MRWLVPRRARAIACHSGTCSSFIFILSLSYSSLLCSYSTTRGTHSKYLWNWTWSSVNALESLWVENTVDWFIWQPVKPQSESSSMHAPLVSGLYGLHGLLNQISELPKYVIMIMIMMIIIIIIIIVIIIIITIYFK